MSIYLAADTGYTFHPAIMAATSMRIASYLSYNAQAPASSNQPAIYQKKAGS
jgi:hypothetical protein